MKRPWVFFPRTWRDQLHDIAVSFSEVMAGALPHDTLSSLQDAKQDRADQIVLLEQRLGSWHLSWIRKEYPSYLLNCDCPLVRSLSCICTLPVSGFAKSDFALLQMEYLSLQLLISTRLVELFEARVQHEAIHHVHFSTRSSRIASNMYRLYEESPFQRTAEQGSGITEVVCRNILSTWALDGYLESRNRLLASTVPSDVQVH